MVSKNRGTYGFLGTSWVLITMAPRNITSLLVCVGWVGVDWQRHCKTCRSLIEPDNQGTHRFVLFFWRSPQLAVELLRDHLCAAEKP